MNESNKNVKTLPALAYLNECFILDADAGTLTWKVRPRSEFKRYKDCNMWNTKYVGEVAGCTKGRYGICRLNGVSYPLHRVIYYMATGVTPLGYHVDHIDGDKHNNSAVNLRLATNAENARNRAKLDVRSTSGYRGVSQRGNTFRAYAMYNGLTHRFGTHDTAELANQAAIAGRAKLFGEFA